jgi:hypothetical protein
MSVSHEMMSSSTPKALEINLNNSYSKFVSIDDNIYISLIAPSEFNAKNWSNDFISKN